MRSLSDLWGHGQYALLSFPEERPGYPAAHLCPPAQASQADLLPLCRQCSVGLDQLLHSRATTGKKLFWFLLLTFQTPLSTGSAEYQALIFS
jgi:hypothetical protein